MQVLQTQLIIGNIVGSFAIFLSTVPFFTAIGGEYSKSKDLVDRKVNYSYYGSVSKIYIIQIIISFVFMWFVKLWDLIVKKDEYKLEGSGHCFELFWGDWKSGMNTTDEALKGLYAYQGMIREPFENILSLSMIAVPLVAILIASLTYSQGRGQGQHKDGSSVVHQSFNNVLFVTTSLVLYVFYLKIIDVSLRMDIPALTMVTNWWKALLL